MTIPQSVQQLVRGKQTLTSALVEAGDKDKHVSPEKFIEKLYHHHEVGHKAENVAAPTSQDLQEVLQLGTFGNTQPSELFLKVGVCLNSFSVCVHTY